jgi:hypothetical protein
MEMRIQERPRWGTEAANLLGEVYSTRAAWFWGDADADFRCDLSYWNRRETESSAAVIFAIVVWSNSINMKCSLLALSRVADSKNRADRFGASGYLISAKTPGTKPPSAPLPPRLRN